MFDNILKFILLASVTVPNVFNQDSLRAFENKMFCIFALMIIASGMISQAQRNIPKSILNISSSLIFVSIVSVLLHGFNGLVVSYAVNITLFVVSTLFIVSTLQDVKSCTRFLIIGAVFNTVMVLIEKNYGNPILSVPYPYIGGMIGNLPRLSLYFAIILPVVYGSGKLVSALLILISLFAYVQAQVLCFIGILLIIFLNCKSAKVRMAMIIGLVLGALYFWPKIEQSLQVRFDTWWPLVNIFFSDWKYPLFGNGLGVSPDVGKSHDGQIWSSHLQFLFGTGIVGILVYFIFFKHFFKTMRLNYETIAVVNILLIALIDYPFEVLKLWPTLAFIFGVYFIKSIKEGIY